MFLYGVLGNFLHLGNDIILRVLFYFPSLIFGFFGVYFLTKTLKLSKTVTFFATLVYLVNTYYLLLVDGGQVGVVLAYGLFPFVLNFLIKYVEKNSIINFVIALLMSFVLTIVDFRVAVICIFTTILLKPGLRSVKFLVLISICLIGLSAYWIVPVLSLSSPLSTNVAGLQSTTLLNAFLLSAPNWPANEFGRTLAPYFYFYLVPVLIFIPLFRSKERKFVWFSFIFLIFLFLVKGSSDPFGFLYTAFIRTKGGSVFRDSTKFFIPLILVGGILIGKTVEIISEACH